MDVSSTPEADLSFPSVQTQDPGMDEASFKNLESDEAIASFASCWLRHCQWVFFEEFPERLASGVETLKEKIIGEAFIILPSLAGPSSMPGIAYISEIKK